MAEKMADALLLPEVAEVSPMELEREGKSYTSDTLAQLREQYPDAELWLLMGTDMFLTLHLWHESEKILELAGVCAFGRTEQDTEEVFAPSVSFCKRPSQARGSPPSPCPGWWTSPPQGCGSCWPGARGRSTSTPRSADTF